MNKDAAAGKAADKETSKTISLPKSDEPLSALSGVTMMAIDTDPEESLRLVKANILQNGWTLLSVIQHEFHGRPPYGFIVVYYDPSADKGHERFGKPAFVVSQPQAAAPAPPPPVSGAGISTALSD